MSYTNKSVFDNSLFDLPIRRNGQDFLFFLKSCFSEYFTQIGRFKDDIKKELKPKKPTIEKQIGEILSALESYYKGFPAIAYNKIANLLDELEANNSLPIQQLDIKKGRNNFYRIRVSDNKSLQKKDLFHIPFHLREKVTTQRYSIPGLPCLYLGDSIFICWEELNRPNFDSLHVSRFDLSVANYKFLYLNVSVADIRKRHFSEKRPEGHFIPNFAGFISNWPLYAACSFVVDKPNEVFKPEYIIPQLILQWVVSSRKLDGIFYKSNRINTSEHSLGTFTNAVIPIKEVSEKGFCSDLVTKIKLTNPVSWQLLDISNPSTKNSTETLLDIQAADLRRAMYIELIEGEKTFYQDTKFGILEERLKTMSTDYLKR